MPRTTIRNSRPSAQLDLAQLNIRFPRQTEKDVDLLADREKITAPEIGRRAIDLYLALRRVLPEKIWYDLEAEAKTLGKEPGAVIATRLVDALERSGR
jgi:hypothetical protein